MRYGPIINSHHSLDGAADTVKRRPEVTVKLQQRGVYAKFL
jgi:hypothetical protein